MIKKIEIVSFILILLCVIIYVFLNGINVYSVYVQNKIIDSVFNINVDEIKDASIDSNDSYSNMYLGYIEIPKYDIKRLIKYGTGADILNIGYVGMHELSGNLSDDDLIILAGHNISSVFSKLHFLSNGDFVYINTVGILRKFVVYDVRVVSEYDIDYLLDNRKNELLLITCTKKNGERLLVFLREVL